MVNVVFLTFKSFFFGFIITELCNFQVQAYYSQMGYLNLFKYSYKLNKHY